METSTEGAPGGAPPWRPVSAGPRARPDGRPVTLRRVVLQVIAAGVVVLALVAIGGAVASRRAAERESVNDALKITDLLADSVVQPALEDELLTGSPEALDRLDTLVRERVLDESIVRVKIWAPDGTIVYSDEPRLIGSKFPLDLDERAVFTDPTTEAEVSDLRRPENRYERSQGKLLEVYRPVWTPQAQPLLFETYSRYSAVTARTSQLWRGFAGITVSSLLVLLVLLLPLGWALLGRLRQSQAEQVTLLRRAVEASDNERQRIAATLHDGAVQELAGSSFAVAAAAERADALGEQQLAERLRAAAGTVRASIGGLRSLLVDIYPPSLRNAGLAAALTDLAGTLRSRGIEVRLSVPELELDPDAEAMVFRIAQECVRNIARHASARTVDFTLARDGDGVRLEIGDDGVGFDLDDALESTEDGHFGLRLMSDLAVQTGAVLSVATAPGAGTRWRLEVPDR